MLKCRIFRRPCSMTKKQYSSLEVTVGTVKKSRATITSRWFWRKVSQRLPGSPRRRRRRRYLATVRSQTAKPSLSISPWILGAPQPTFSSAIRRMRERISSLTLGRPPRGLDRQRQYRRNPARCQPTTVSGLTIARTSDQRGQSCRKVVQKKRSQWVSTGRGRFRFKTATCCLSARTSKEVSTRLRKKTRIVTTNVEIKSSTNPFL